MRDPQKLCVLLLIANAIALVAAQGSGDTSELGGTIASPLKVPAGRPRSSRGGSQKYLLAKSNGEKGSSGDRQASVTVNPNDSVLHAAVDPCGIASQYIFGRIPYAVAKACLNANFPFPANSRKDTADTVKSLISNFYVFEDMAAFPPENEDYTQGLDFRPVKLVQEIDSLYYMSAASLADSSKNVQDDDGDDDDDDDDGNNNSGSGDSSDPVEGVGAAARTLTDREFHDGISDILVKARDGHLSYDADCFRPFNFHLGFSMSHVARSGVKVVKVSNVNQYFKTQSKLTREIYGCDVVQIEGMDAAQYIQQWADENVELSKDPNVRFNAALASPVFSQLGEGYFYEGAFVSRFKLPTESALQFTFKCRSQPQPFTASIPWTASYSRPRFFDTQSYYNVNCAKSNNGNSIPKESPNKQNPDGKPTHEEGVAQDQEELKELYSQLESLIDSENMDAMSEDPSFSSPSSTQGEHSERINEIVARINALESQVLPVHKFYDEARIHSSSMDHGDALNYQILYKGKQGITAALLDDGKTGVLIIPKESSQDKSLTYTQFYSEWIPAIIDSFQALAPKAENLILDLTHNGGGFICMGSVLLKLFFPEDIPYVTNLRFTPMVKEMLASNMLGISYYVSPYGKPPLNGFSNDYYLEEASYTNRGYSFSNYLLDVCPKDKFTFKIDSNVEARRKRTRPQTNAQLYRPWDPENLAILTDGHCGSTCALISNTLRYKYGVPAVVVGGNNLASAGPMSYSTFPGLHVADDEYLFQNMRGSLEDVAATSTSHHRNATDFAGSRIPRPKAFAHKARQRMTYRQIYYTGTTTDQFVYSEANSRYEPAWLDGDEDQTWNEYRFLPATHRVDYSDRNVNSISTIWEEARNAVWGS